MPPSWPIYHIDQCVSPKQINKRTNKKITTFYSWICNAHTSYICLKVSEKLLPYIVQSISLLYVTHSCFCFLSILNGILAIRPKFYCFQFFFVVPSSAPFPSLNCSNSIFIFLSSVKWINYFSSCTISWIKRRRFEGVFTQYSVKWKFSSLHNVQKAIWHKERAWETKEGR